MNNRSHRPKIYDAPPQDGATGLPPLVRRVLTWVGIVMLAGGLLWFVWFAIEVLLVLFAGTLLAVFLRGLSDTVRDHTPLADDWALGVTVLGLLALFGVGGWLLAPAVSEQFSQLLDEVPRSASAVRDRLEDTRWGHFLLDQMPQIQEAAPDGGEIASQVTGIFSTALGGIVNVMIILFVGLYLAIDPHTYLQGAVRLVPLQKRDRAREILHVLGYTLRRWLIGRAILMLVIGVVTTIGLGLLGVPLPVALGVIAALLSFIPNLGPVLSALPAVLLGLSTGPMTAVYVIALYASIQTVESYVFAPLVEQRTVFLPPVLVITAQVLMGISLGVLGLLLATPLFAVVLVLVKMLYVEDTLGDRQIAVRGEEEAHQQVAAG